MVFQRKSGGAKVKQQTPAKGKGKKTVESKDLGDEDMSFDETDSDDSGSDGAIEKKTPGGKTPKGKQGDKRVSFQVPGKNTPANKTPRNENPVGKKQPTPGKAAALKEFQGMLTSSAKKNGGTKRPAEDDDDEDEDEDEDDDDSDEDADLDMLLDGASDDDDDDDEDEDDEDDDEDDDEEEDEDDDDEDDEQPKKSQNSKQNSSKNIVTKEASVVQKSPSKNLEKMPAKKEQSSKNSEKQNIKGKTSEKEAQSPFNEKKKTSPDLKKALEIDAQQKRERDSKTLFIGNLPTDITPTELKALSSDIVEVHLPTNFNRKKRKSIFAFLEFANEAKAEENYKILNNKKLRGQPMKIDFRRGNQSAESGSKLDGRNLRKLFIPTLPLDVTIDQIASLFKKAFQITINTGVAQKHATVNFQNEKDAAEALEACKSAKIGNTAITVMFSIVTERNKKKRKQKPKTKFPASKKMKLEVKQESDDDEDDDDDDEDDD